MSRGTAGGSAAGRTRKGALALSGAAAVTAAAAVVGFLANADHFQRAEMATRVPRAAEKTKEEEEGDIVERCRGFMSAPVTDVSVLQKRKEEMSTKMEMLIMETQAEFCKALQEVDGGTFMVDRWDRKEGETCITELLKSQQQLSFPPQKLLICFCLCFRWWRNQLCDAGWESV